MYARFRTARSRTATASSPSSAMSDQQEPASVAPREDWFLVGFVVAKIVGLRHYSGAVSGREMVALVLEPLNLHDPNAIKVVNTRSEQVGYVERTVAAVIAPVIDAGVAVAEGIVPAAPPRRNHFRLPLQIHIFSYFDFIDEVQRVLAAQAGISFFPSGDVGFELSEAAIVRQENPVRSAQTIDEVFCSCPEKGKNLAAVEPPADIVTSDLFLHQKEALGWMVHRENSNELPPYWEEEDGEYTNVLTNHRTRERPEPLKGGIFADDMGLGKTLTMISLIATNRPGHSPYIKFPCDEEDDEEVVKGSKKVKSTKKVVGCRKRKRLNEWYMVSDVGATLVPKPTLIVCPLSVFSTWTTQFEEHTKRGSLKIYMYYGDRTKDPAELQKYDVVLTTYSTLGTELNSENSPVNEVDWLRVILDEAHVIKNPSAKQTEAVIKLKAERRWVVTGTPIQNGSSDLFSLMAFLRFQPFSMKCYWQSLIQRPLDRGKACGLLRLQALMDVISLRRTKDSMNIAGLPKKYMHICYVDLSPEERERYDLMEAEAKSAVNEYINNDTVTRNFSCILQIILRLRQICDDMALCPPELKSLFSTETLEDASNSPELLIKLVSILQDGDDFDCPVCLSPPKESVITACAHVFCNTCMMRVLKGNNPRCPMCRNTLAASKVYKSPVDPTKENDPPIASSSTSSKVSALIKLLNKSREQNRNCKSVVFSQFRKMLILLEGPLKSNGFRVLRLDGTMNAKKRAEVIREFGDAGEGSPNVLLASLKAAGTGINLTAASMLYLVDPWWNPAVEEQAMDRIHRIGQINDVNVYRLIVRNSIEERILALQEKKKRLATGAFNKTGKNDQRQVRIEDLRAMMQL